MPLRYFLLAAWLLLTSYLRLGHANGALKRPVLHTLVFHSGTPSAASEIVAELSLLLNDSSRLLCVPAATSAPSSSSSSGQPDGAPANKPSASRKVLIVLNPVGGVGASKKTFETIVKPMLTLARVDYELICTYRLPAD